MENVNWLKLKLNQKMLNLQAAKANVNAANLNPRPAVGGDTLMQQTHNNIINNVQRQFANPEQMRMNSMASIDRAIYIKNLLNLPKDMLDLLILVQNNGKMPNLQGPNQNNQVQNPNPNQTQNPNPQNPNPNPDESSGGNKNPVLPKPLLKPDGEAFRKHFINNNPAFKNEKSDKILDKNTEILQNQKQTVQENLRNNLLNRFDSNAQTHNQIGQKFVPQGLNVSKKFNVLHDRNKIHSQQLHDKVQQEEEFIELLSANSQKTQKMSPEELAAFRQQLASQLHKNINLTNVSAFLQKNSKLALNKMVAMMSLATSQGMSDIKPLQETINIINASVSANSANNATQTLKNLMLLYLPWLPLQEGVGFDLEIEQDEEIPESESFIKIMITTVNFGNLNAVVSLVSSNSVDVSITCSEKFPKKELFKRLFKAGSQHSMQTVIDFKDQKLQLEQDAAVPKAKVNLSNVNQVNPYLLLMSHALIRYTIEIDNAQSTGTSIISS